MRRSATVWPSVQSTSDNDGFEPSNRAMCRGLLTSVQSASEIDTGCPRLRSIANAELGHFSLPEPHNAAVKRSPIALQNLHYRRLKSSMGEGPEIALRAPPASPLSSAKTSEGPGSVDPSVTATASPVGLIPSAFGFAGRSMHAKEICRSGECVAAKLSRPRWIGAWS